MNKQLNRFHFVKAAYHFYNFAETVCSIEYLQSSVLCTAFYFAFLQNQFKRCPFLRNMIGRRLLVFILGHWTRL